MNDQHDNPGKTCLVIVPAPGSKIAGEQKRALEFAVKPLLKNMKYKSLLAHALPGPGSRTPKTVRALFNADLAIADLTTRDPDVLYQVGIRHAAGGLVVCISQKEETLPDLLKDVPIIHYGEMEDPDKVSDLVKAIEKQVSSAEEHPEDVDNPVHQAVQDQLNQRKLVLYESTFEEIADQQKKLGRQIDKLNDLRCLIADYTRKPLMGIPEIFLALHRLLQDTRENSCIWYVGMTLGFGIPHRHRLSKHGDRGIRIDDELHSLSPDVPTFDKMIKEYMKDLSKIVADAPQATIVTLNQDLDFLKDSFLRPLAERTSYKELKGKLDSVAGEIKERHDEVAGAVSPERPVRYLPSLPLQMLIVEKESSEQKAVTRRACLVFHVGTENVGSKLMEEGAGELGFYTEIEDTVQMFATMAESLYLSAKSG